MDKNLNFDTIGGAVKRRLRPINPDRIASDVSFELEKSEGVRPSVAFMPHRFSPTIKKIHTVSNEEFGIAIPKGTIVSAVPVVSKEAYIAGFANNGTPIADASGEQVVGKDYEGNDLKVSVDNMLYGYGKVINAAVIANGGVTVKDNYSQYDVDTERQKPDGSLVTTADTFERAANIPLGIAQEDIYINREGQYLNASESQFQLFDSLLSDYFIAVPFVVSNATYPVTCTVDGAGNKTMSAAYKAIYDNGIACLIANAKEDLFTLGNYVKSDPNGKFIPQFAAADALTSSPNSQTVGRIYAVDVKFPKDLVDIVQNYSNTATPGIYPNSHSGGTATYGLPLELYRLVYYVINAANGPVTYDKIIDAINAGIFGIVYINLHVN